MDKVEKKIDDLTEVVRGFAENVQEQFDGVNARFDGVNQQFEGVSQQFEGINTRLNKIEATMVTKDYLDDKLADLRGDLNVMIRKEDTKVTALIKRLKDKDVLTEEDEKDLLSMEPFAKLV